MLFFIQEQFESSWLSFHQCLLPRIRRCISKMFHSLMLHTTSYKISPQYQTHFYFLLYLVPTQFLPLFQLSMEVQFSLAYHIQAAVKSEQNRQIMCEGGLISTLLAHCQSMLLAPNHPLHLPVTRILEKLSSQSITHSDFRSDMLSLWGSDGFHVF